MPQDATTNTIARQWELLKQLPARPPGITASELVQALQERGFMISKRSVERDLRDLSLIFPLQCNDKGIPHGWHWMKGAALDLPALSVADALSLRLLQDYLQTLLPASIVAVLQPRFAEAARKLEQLTETNTAASWMDKVRVVPATLPLLPAEVPEGVMETVQSALMQNYQLDCDYCSASGEESTRQLHPLALVQRGPVSYLVATANESEEERLYALHRMRRAEMIETPAERPNGFDIDAYIASGALQFGNGKSLRLRAKINEVLASHLGETPLSEDMQINCRNEEYTLTATIADSWQLRWWLLSWGSAVEVLGPKKLRVELSDEIYDACAKYSEA